MPPCLHGWLTTFVKLTAIGLREVTRKVKFRPRFTRIGLYRKWDAAKYPLIQPRPKLGEDRTFWTWFATMALPEVANYWALKKKSQKILNFTRNDKHSHIFWCFYIFSSKYHVFIFLEIWYREFRRCKQQSHWSIWLNYLQFQANVKSCQKLEELT